MLTFIKSAVSGNVYIGTVDGGTIEVIVLNRRNTAEAQYFSALFRVEFGYEREAGLRLRPLLQAQMRSSRRRRQRSRITRGCVIAASGGIACSGSRRNLYSKSLMRSRPLA